MHRPALEFSKEEEGGIPGVEKEEIPRAEPWQHGEEFLPLCGVGWGHGEVVDDSADHVVEGREEHLGAVASLGRAEEVPEFVASLGADPGTVHGEDAVSVPAKGGSVGLVELVTGLVEERSDELGVDLLPGLAERGTGDGVHGGEGDAMVPALVPEGVKEGLVAAPPGVGDEVEEEGDEEFEGKRAAPREVLLTFSENGGIHAGQEARECSKIISDLAGTGMGLADRILCRSCWISHFLLKLFHEHRPGVAGAHIISLRSSSEVYNPASG
jgi:hypothetical protein